MNVFKISMCLWNKFNNWQKQTKLDVLVVPMSSNLCKFDKINSMYDVLSRVLLARPKRHDRDFC